MRRREFITLLGGAAASWPLPARAQQGERMRRVGMLMSGSADDPDQLVRVAAFREAFEKLGWAEGRNVRIDLRFAATDPERVRSYAAALLSQAPDVILANSTPVLEELLKQTRSVPIVFNGVSDPVSAGFVPSLARPGGNITGFSAFEYSIGGKWLEILKEAAPGTKRVAVLLFRGDPSGLAWWAWYELIRSPYLTHGFMTLDLQFRLPPGMTLPPDKDDVHIDVGEGGRRQAIVSLNGSWRGHDGDRQVILATASLMYKASQRVVTLELPGMPSHSWRLDLSSDPDPTPGFSAWRLPSSASGTETEMNFRLRADR